MSRVNRLARYLISVGVGPESLVALAMRRSVDLVVGMYAVVAAGGGVCSGGSGSAGRIVRRHHSRGLRLRCVWFSTLLMTVWCCRW